MCFWSRQGGAADQPASAAAETHGRTDTPEGMFALPPVIFQGIAKDLAMLPPLLLYFTNDICSFAL